MTDAIWRDAKAVYDFLADVPGTAHADLILAAGSHDLRAAEEAARCWLEGAAPIIVCSGGYGKMTEGRFPKPEAELFAERCMALGVPENAILVENRSTNTGENFLFSKALLSRRGIFPKIGIVTCKPYMAKRCWATGMKQWSEVRWFARTPALRFEDYPTEEAPLESAIQLMVGDLQRCRVYAEKGYQVPVPVPEEIWAACLRLAEAGYNEQFIRD